MKGIDFKGLRIGPGLPTFIIAEAGVNHNGSIDLALQLVDAAAEAGADAVKFQTFVTEELITRHSPKAEYHIATTGTDQSQSWFALLKSEELSAADFARVKARCEERRIVFMSTPYDEPSVDLLDRLDVVAYKIASTDSNNLPFLEYVASKRRPVILSTGMCTMDEVRESVAALRRGGCEQLVLMHCTAEYPAPLEEANLRAMTTMSRELDVPVGYSDHVPSLSAALASVALGSCVYEKHFTLDRSLPGPDHRASVEPAELKDLVQAMRAVEAALGDGVKRVMPSEAANRPLLRKSVVAKRDIGAGERLGRNNLAIKRAGGQGMPPGAYYALIGRTARATIPAETPISEPLLAPRTP
ncbi:MAG: N-acetylneuraminate synthase [Alphaproteobacteria bacterium]